MTRPSELWRRLRASLRGGRLDRELADEMAFHVEMEAVARRRAGESPAEALRGARLSFGGESRHAELAREARGLPRLESLWRDVVIGARGLRRSPGFTGVALATLGLAIGAAVTVFSVVDGVLLRPLVYGSADELYTVLEQGPDPAAVRTPSYPTAADWRAQSASFAGLAYLRGDDFLVRTELGTQRLIAGFVSPEFFGVMGTEPLLGRAFHEVEPGGEHVVVLSHRLWREAYGGDRAILGRVLSAGDASFTVIGVMPPGFAQPEWADVWAPLGALPPEIAAYVRTRRDLHVDARVIGRLAPGVAPERAAAELGVIGARLAAAYPSEYGEWQGAQLRPLRDAVVGDAPRTLAVLAAAVLVLLLIANVNVANLLLARGAARRREMAVRQSLGARRTRLVRQLLVEGALLAGLGGAIGTALAALGVRALRLHLPAALPRLDELAIDTRVLLFVLALALVCPLLFALVPALRTTEGAPGSPLRTGGAGSGASRGTVRLRSVLVVAQVALAIVLVIGSGLLIKSLWRLQQVELGIDPSGVVAVRVFPPSPRYDDEAAALALYERLREVAARVPGVRHAALANHVSMAGGWMTTRVLGGTAPPADDGAQPIAILRSVSPEYFDVLRVPVLRGRSLGTDDEVGAGGGAAVVNEAFVQRFFPDEDALGRTVTLHHAAQGRARFGEPYTATIVGITGDERFFGPERPVAAAVYVPHTADVWGNIFVVARTGGDPRAVIPALRSALLGVDPELPIAGPGLQTEIRPLVDYVRTQTEVRRVSAGVLTGFGVVALVLALIGIVGVVAYVVAQRTRELGVRLALGATPGDVLRLVMRHACTLVGAGVVTGTLAAVAATRLLQSHLFEVSATDPAVYGAVALLFAVAACAGSLVPAVRAARADPTRSLRME